MMQVLLTETDGLSGATYITLREDQVARTVDVGEAVMVDLNGYGEPIGVEFPFGQPAAGADAWHHLMSAFPSLKEAFHQYL